MALPGNGTCLATSESRLELYKTASKRIVDMAYEWSKGGCKKTYKLLPKNIMSKKAFENAMTLDMAMGGSTNTVLHLLAIANEATAALSRADALPPLGMAGMLRASREADVQKGIAVVLELLRHVGRASTHLTHGGTTAPRSAPRPRPGTAGPSPAVTRARQAPRTTGAAAAPPPAQEAVTFMNARFLADGTLLEPEKWSRDMAIALAATVGVTDMADDHWRVIDFARQEYADTSHSPNIRRLTEGSGIDTRRLYALFPQAPGRAVARVAGLPKPAGCI